MNIPQRLSTSPDSPPPPGGTGPSLRLLWGMVAKVRQSEYEFWLHHLEVVPGGGRCPDETQDALGKSGEHSALSFPQTEKGRLVMLVTLQGCPTTLKAAGHPVGGFPSLPCPYLKTSCGFHSCLGFHRSVLKSFVSVVLKRTFAKMEPRIPVYSSLRC